MFKCCCFPKRTTEGFHLLLFLTKLSIVLVLYYVSFKTFHPLYINFNPLLPQKIYYLWKIFKTNTIQIITPRSLCLGGSYYHERT